MIQLLNLDIGYSKQILTLTLLIPMTSKDISRSRSHRYGGILGRFF